MCSNYFLHTPALPCTITVICTHLLILSFQYFNKITKGSSSHSLHHTRSSTYKRPGNLLLWKLHSHSFISTSVTHSKATETLHNLLFHRYQSWNTHSKPPSLLWRKHRLPMHSQPGLWSRPKNHPTPTPGIQTPLKLVISLPSNIK